MINAFDGVTFRLNGLVFAIDALKVREVIGGAEWVEGEDGTLSAIQARNGVIPVLDLRKLFGCPSQEKRKLNSFIAVQIPGADRSRLAALWVDTLLEMIHVPAGGLKSPPESIGGVQARFLHSFLEKDGERIYVIQTEAIVREEFLDEKELDKAAS